MRSQQLLNQDSYQRDLELVKLLKELTERLVRLEERVAETVGLGG